jgi:plasmid stabilization system protein ParE
MPTSAYFLTPLAKADIFDIWAYIAENSETAAERVEQAIYDVSLRPLRLCERLYWFRALL